MTAPRLGDGMPADASWFSKQIADLQRQIRENQAAQSVGTITPTAANISKTNVDLAGDIQDAVSENIQVPDGFTGAAVLLTVVLEGTRDASVGGVNQLSIEAYADVQVANPPIKTLTFDTAGQHASITQTFAASLAGLSGEFAVGAKGWGSTGWVTASGVGSLSFIVLFTR